MPSASSCLLHFFVSQKIHIKRSLNGIKTDGHFFWNIYDFWEEESTRDDTRGGHEVGGAPYPPGRSLHPFGHLEASLTCTPSLLGVFWSRKNHGESFIPFVLCLVFLFCETLKYAKKTETGTGLSVNSLVPKII